MRLYFLKSISELLGNFKDEIVGVATKWPSFSIKAKFDLAYNSIILLSRSGFCLISVSILLSTFIFILQYHLDTFPPIQNISKYSNHFFKTFRSSSIACLFAVNLLPV